MMLANSRSAASRERDRSDGSACATERTERRPACNEARAPNRQVVDMDPSQNRGCGTATGHRWWGGAVARRSRENVTHGRATNSVGTGSGGPRDVTELAHERVQAPTGHRRPLRPRRRPGNVFTVHDDRGPAAHGTSTIEYAHRAAELTDAVRDRRLHEEGIPRELPDPAVVVQVLAALERLDGSLGLWAERAAVNAVDRMTELAQALLDTADVGPTR